MGSKSDVQVGSKFGRWTVLALDVYNPNSKAKPHKQALCQCECGTQRYKDYRDLYDGRSLSCGCRRNEQTRQRNIEKGAIPVGSRFGHLTVIEDLGLCLQSRGKYASWSRCRCDCGTIIDVINNNLKTGGTQSCGCVKSRGETAIRKILLDNNIPFSTEYTFYDLRGENNKTLRFDFAIFKNDQLYELIEFDGRQHYIGPDATWSQSDSLETIQSRDELKNQYCKKHNIKLVRVPYYNIGKIDLELLGLEDYNINDNYK